MRKFTIFFLFFAFYILHSTFYIPTALAVESTPSADPLRQSDSEASIKIKLEELKKEIASKAAKLKLDIDKKLTNKAYVGKIKTKSATSVTLATKTGPKIVSINQDTEFESKLKGKKFSQKAISEEDFVVALGDIDETDVLTAKKILLIAEPKESGKNSVWGQVVAISDQLITLKTREGKNMAVTLPPTSSVKLNEFVILTGIMGKNEIFDAEFVYVIPQGAILNPKKLATPSAQTSTKSSQPKR